MSRLSSPNLRICGEATSSSIGVVADVAELLARLDEMVAGVEIAIVLQGRPVAAGRRVNAEKMTTEVCLERHVEELHEHAADVAPHPFLENVDQETAVLLAADRTFGHQIPGLRVQQSLAAGPIAPALIGDGDRLGASRAR